MAETTVLYPKGTKFNMDYYLSSHMPLVGNSFKSKGLKGWKVLDFGSEAEYCVQATLEWDSQKSFETAAATEEMVRTFYECWKIMDDVPNFSDKQPMLIPGIVKGTM
ncbi:hypothetical protein B0A54_12443 [Friedmanniomyces endolithicus]|uniref:EthD domain-containing protein n=1 Tax=Friedmanniomyces endolithicus TaxID=329885 RepID=A0A4V5N6L8_9PEZI|nr:hypothetical protein B0A54_12443 [Friedmanniomyces endolithicus]